MTTSSIKGFLRQWMTKCFGYHSFKAIVQHWRTMYFGDYEFVRYASLSFKWRDKDLQFTFPLLVSDRYFQNVFDCFLTPNCCICRYPRQYDSLKGGTGYGLICNQHFLDQFDEREQNAVILHEIGHYFQEDFTEKKDYRRREIDMEIDADSYACKYGYAQDMIRALEKAKAVNPDNAEIDARVEKLRQYKAPGDEKALRLQRAMTFCTW